MDFQRPVEAVIPGVQGRILAVLAETTAELNLRTIARLADVSPARASRLLPELVALGLVARREAPPSALFVLVEDNVASRAVRALSRSRDTVLEELGNLAQQMDPMPASAIVFGSFARGAAHAASDVDVVRPRTSVRTTLGGCHPRIGGGPQLDDSLGTPSRCSKSMRPRSLAVSDAPPPSG